MATFHDIIGQEQIKEHLQNAISAKKISHAYIINGEKSSGKEFIARVFAMTLQCEKGGTEPCQECHSCKQALSDNQPDIIYVSHEKPNTISVDDIRAQINNDIAIKPYSSPYKIYIMNEAEKMTPQAQNAILKTLEEPPAHVIFILATTEANKIPVTILSRCQRYDFKRLTVEQIEEPMNWCVIISCISCRCRIIKRRSVWHLPEVISARRNPWRPVRTSIILRMKRCRY